MGTIFLVYPNMLKQEAGFDTGFFARGGRGGGTSIAYSGFVRGFFVGVVGRLIACV